MRVVRHGALIATLLTATAAQAQPQASGATEVPEASESPEAAAAETPAASEADTTNTAATTETEPAQTVEAVGEPKAATEEPAPDGASAAATEAASVGGQPGAEGDVATAGEAELEALTAAELASLGLEVGDDGLDTDLHFSGFMDVSYVHLLNPEEAPLAAATDGDEASFFVGRINLYATKNLSDSFSMMLELRFTYAPNGTAGVNPGVPTQSTETLDYSGSALSFRWGGIVIERAYGQWSPSPYFNVRAGAFLTPYGIWNVDHGSPVFITVKRPFAVGGNFFPERQTGLEMFGRVALGSRLSAGYHLTLSNGLGPVSEYRDLDSNKAIGGRLVLEHLGQRGSRFQFGGSAFYGQNSASAPQIGISADGMELTLLKSAAGRADVTSLAADMQWKYEGVLLQSEWVGQRWIYDEKGRTVLPTAGQLGIPVNALAPDAFNWGGYALLGYRLPWWGIMPFGTLEYARSNNFGIDTRTAYSQVGLNIRPVGAIVFKLQYQFTFAASPGTAGKALGGQLAWAF